MGAKGFNILARILKEQADRAARPQMALKAIGRNAVNRHIRNFRSGSQGGTGGGPPGDQWPGLEDSTIEAKNKHWGQYRGKPKTQKLVNTGLLKAGFEYRVGSNAVEIYNREDEKVGYLQVNGVGKKKKKFTIVATDLERQDPQLLKESEEITADFLFSGRLTK